jgi:CheY-like chemotaxis protein
VRGEPPRPAARAGRILVIEDSPSARRLLQDVLLRLGAELPNLRMAGTVLEGLTTFTEWRPQVVFIDVELGRGETASGTAPAVTPSPRDPVDGAELARLILSRNPTVKVVICSATDPSDRRVAPLVQNRQVEFITKPLLASRVEEVLARAVPTVGRRAT